MPDLGREMVGSTGRVFVPIYLFGPTLCDSLQLLYGQSREAKVLDALLSSGPLTLSGLCLLCSASERAVRKEGRTGWIRAILLRYRDSGIVVEKDWGNRITYELAADSSAVSLLRDLRRAPAPQVHRRPASDLAKTPRMPQSRRQRASLAPENSAGPLRTR